MNKDELVSKVRDILYTKLLENGMELSPEVRSIIEKRTEELIDKAILNNRLENRYKTMIRTIVDEIVCEGAPAFEATEEIIDEVIEDCTKEEIIDPKEELNELSVITQDEDD